MFIWFFDELYIIICNSIAILTETYQKYPLNIK